MVIEGIDPHLTMNTHDLPNLQNSTFAKIPEIPYFNS